MLKSPEISLSFKESSLHCRNMKMFHQFRGIMESNFSDMGGIVS